MPDGCIVQMARCVFGLLGFGLFCCCLLLSSVVCVAVCCVNLVPCIRRVFWKELFLGGGGRLVR